MQRHVIQELLMVTRPTNYHLHSNYTHLTDRATQPAHAEQIDHKLNPTPNYTLEINKNKTSNLTLSGVSSTFHHQFT